MSKEREATAGTFWAQMFQPGVYKRTQGRITRQVTFGALFFALAVGCWRLSTMLMGYASEMRFGIPLVLFAVGAWFVYRLVNMPRFADFLIAVEAEMAKVSWPTKPELVRSSIVVMVTIFGLAAILALYDTFWRLLLRALNVVGGG